MTAYPITAYALCNALGDDAHAVIASLERGATGLGRRGFACDVDTVWGAIVDPPALPSSLQAYDTRQARIVAAALAPIVVPVQRACTRWGSARVAVVLGSSTGGIGATERAWAESRTTGTWPTWFDLQRHHAMQASLEVVRACVPIRGPGWVVSTACSSSAKAFASAQRLLDADLADAVLVGGVDSLCELTIRGFAALEVTARGPCRPFAADRDGISLGEGGAFALLERHGDASTRLLAVGESCDAYHMSSPEPEGAGAIAAIASALAAAGLAPAQIDFVNAHATGTKVGDAAEAKAIASVLGHTTPVVATKGFTGHLLGAAGATEILLCVAALERGWLPASLGATPLDPSLAIDVTTERRAIDAATALSTSFAFGGSNAAVIVGVSP